MRTANQTVLCLFQQQEIVSDDTTITLRKLQSARFGLNYRARQ